MEIDRVAEALNAGMVPAAIYSDPEIFDLERDRIFPRTWQFLAHTSEIPEPGDYVVRRILEDSFIVVRDESGEVRVLLNMCLHRGMQVCRAEAGNASHFRCPYHAWTYKNTGELAGVPFHHDAYGGDVGLDRSRTRLLSPPRVEIHREMIFASLDPNVVDLDTYVGDFGYFLDFYLNHSDAGMEVKGPQRWIVSANWKIGSENFGGDSYHTPHTHASVVEIGLFGEPIGHKRRLGALYVAGGGTGTTYKMPTTDFADNLANVGYPPEMIDKMRGRWSPKQQAMVGESGFMVSAATLFPNLSFVHNWPQVDDAGLVAPFVSIRLWQPLSSTQTEIFSWFLVDRSAPEWFKEASFRAYILCFGSSGMFEQDDVENWTSITAVSRGRYARTIALNSRMGLAPDGGTMREPIADWPGPGRAFTGFGEYNQRALLQRWAEYTTSQSAGEGPLVPETTAGATS